MRLLLLLLLPAIAVAQDPTPPPLQGSQQIQLTEEQTRLAQMYRLMDRIRRLSKAIDSGVVELGSGNEITLSSGQISQLETRKSNRKTQLRNVCAALTANP